jgi:DNA (cytosine-5)-methyltransferase 1
VIILENVEEFVTWGPIDKATNKPDPKRVGLTFKRFVGNLRGLGYEVEWRELVAADYGAPTTRKRFFLIARCDGLPIVWPEPTHAAPGWEGDLFDGPRQPWRTAAECIDWNLPCPSIFERQRPLAEATMRRIAAGIKRYVIECKEPFIVRCAHGDDGRRGRGGHPLSEPLPTQTATKDFALVTPYMIGIDHQGSGDGCNWPAGAPLRTITMENRHALVCPSLVGVGGRAGQSAPKGAGEPLSTVTAKGDRALIAAFLKRDFGKSVGREMDGPAPTITQNNHDSLVTAFLAKHYGGVVGHDVQRPIGTVTAIDHHSLVAAHLTKFYGTNVGADPREPMPTITGDGQHLAEVRAFLVKYYGSNVGSDLREPLHTVTTLDRFGLVTVAGVDYQIVDIGLRMLTPRELARAQGFPEDYILTGTKSSQVARIGNSVCPPLAEALVRANCVDSRTAEAVA